MESKSLYRSRAGRHFYGTENVIWAGFGPIGTTEKKVWADYEQLLRKVFACFRVQKKIKKMFENVVASALELVSKELNHFGVIAGLFRQIGGPSSRFVLFCSF
jgi:hypothetical protein